MEPGYVLLIAAGLAMLFGWDLSRRGLSEVKEVAETVKIAATEVRDGVAATQSVLAESTGSEASALASATTRALERTGVIDDGIGQVKDALAGLTGRFAPARVAFALAFLLVLAALVSLDIVSISVAEEAAGSGA